MTAAAEIAPARAPAELGGRGRDDVALLVASRSDGSLESVRFGELPRFLRAGDLLVVNDSATLPAAIAGRTDRGAAVVVHFSTPLDDGGRWVVEVRGADRSRIERPPLGTVIEPAGGGALWLERAHRGSERLVEAAVEMPGGVERHLARRGAPIRYGHRAESWPLAAHQTIFAREPGSAEMPSAGRPFSHALVDTLVARGVLVAPLTLHAGVSSLERDEDPYPERYRVPVATARLVGATRGRGGRVIAVGTTVVRALETVARADGLVAAGAGLTDVVITPGAGLRCVDGLITGWHEPESSHLWMLEAVAGADLLERSYAHAAALGYRGHEFGDSHFILP